MFRQESMYWLTGYDTFGYVYFQCLILTTKGDLVFTYTNGAGTAVVGTNITAEYSADNGSTYTAMTLVSKGTTGGHNLASTDEITLTSTSGTSMRYRIKTLNQSASKQTRIQAVSLGWR